MAHLFTPAELRRVARLFKRRTGIGTDHVAFDDILEASDEALEALCGLMRDTVTELAMPLQSLVAMLSLLGKKDGGSRCIASCTLPPAYGSPQG